MSKMEVTIQDILWAMRKYLIWIILSSVLFGVAAWAYTTFFVEPVYSTSFKMGVSSNERQSGAVVTSTELNTEQRIAYTYQVLLTSQPVMDGLKAYLGKPLTSSISGEVKGATMVIEITVKDTDPERAAETANAVSVVAPQVLGSLPIGGILYSIETAKVPTSPISPSLPSNIGTGVVLGFLLACLVIVLRVLLDTTIWREEDLERGFDLPVLGSVPSMRPDAEAKRRKTRR